MIHSHEDYILMLRSFSASLANSKLCEIALLNVPIIHLEGMYELIYLVCKFNAEAR